MKEPLIILTGPTAVGKTHLSIALAKAVGGEIISADSMQVYKHMDIGSAKIMPTEMDGVRHYLVDELEPFEEFHVVRFQEMARAAMKEIRSRGHIPILVGGTGSIFRQWCGILILRKMKQVPIGRSWKHWQRKREAPGFMRNCVRSIQNLQRPFMKTM